MTIQMGEYRVVAYPACSADDLARMSIKPDYRRDNFLYLEAVCLSTEIKLFSQVIGYDSGDPTLCYLGDALHGLQVISENKMYHFSFFDEKENFIVELPAAVISILPIRNTLIVIHEVGIKKISFKGIELWNVYTDDMVIDFSINSDQEYIVLTLCNATLIRIQLINGSVL
jgi:hypothetical protein